MKRPILVAVMLFGLVVYQNTQVRASHDVNFENYLQQQAVYNYDEFGLGLNYYNGHSVHQDYAKAAWWFRRAAERGEAKAQAKLGLAYEKGQGVPQNNMLAHMWLNLAALQGKEDAKSSRDIVAQRMTPDQIFEAERLARVWERNLDWQGGPDRVPTADEFAKPSGSQR